MELEELYRQYRTEQLMFVNEKIIKSLENEAMINAALALDMIDEKGNIIRDDGQSINHILDFAIYEYKIDGKNAVERYAESHEPENEAEERVLKAMLNSFTTLFRVVNVSPSKHMLFLKDAFYKIKNVRLMDIAFSHSLGTDSLIFTRILPFPELNMTSGAPFAFPGEVEISLTGNYERTLKEKIEDTSINKYIWFCNAYKLYGLDLGFGHVHNHEHHHHDHDHDHDHGHHHHHHDDDCGHEH